MKKIILCLLFVSTSCLAQQTETEIPASPQTEIQKPQKQRDYNAEANFLMLLPIKLKFVLTLICFLILVMPGTFLAGLGAVIMAILSSALYWFPSIFTYIFSAFSGSFILAIIFFFILGMIGFLIDWVLIYILNKFVPIKRTNYVIWIFAFNMLSVASFLAIFFSWIFLYPVKLRH